MDSSYVQVFDDIHRQISRGFSTTFLIGPSPDCGSWVIYGAPFHKVNDVMVSSDYITMAPPSHHTQKRMSARFMLPLEVGRGGWPIRPRPCPPTLRLSSETSELIVY
jgi:hypothetical protein